MLFFQDVLFQKSYEIDLQVEIKLLYLLFGVVVHYTCIENVHISTNKKPNIRIQGRLAQIFGVIFLTDIASEWPLKDVEPSQGRDLENLNIYCF